MDGGKRTKCPLERWWGKKCPQPKNSQTKGGKGTKCSLEKNRKTKGGKGTKCPLEKNRNGEHLNSGTQG
jgi:hypothetical protein